MGGRGSGRPQGGDGFAPAPDREPYERQPDESTKAWYAFTIYRDLGHLRTQAKVLKQIGKSASYKRIVEIWSVKWGWGVRCRAWEDEEDKIRRAEDIKAIRSMRRRHIKLAEAMSDLGESELRKHLAKAKGKAKKSALSSKEIIRLIESAAKLETRSYGEPEELTRQEITNAPDAGPFRTEIVFVKPDDKS